jgi:hypothetical protein
METSRAVTSTPDETAYAYSLVDVALRTHQAVASAGEAQLTSLRRFKAKKILTGEERVAERLVYTRCFDTIASDRGVNVVDLYCQPWRTSDSKSASQHLQKRKQLHSSRPTSLDQTDRTSRTTSRTSRTKTRSSLRTAQ